jgi:alkanesulfonate monooxygenase SsuD/methylene tetrahydromethanopterin reductase-like flavin-dependent oxidoreductase (luciferase family)
VNGSLPILVGTGSPRMLRLTARWADEWNTWGDPDEVADRTQRFLIACEAEGRDPASLRRSAQANIYYVRTPDERAKAENDAAANRSLIGGASELVDQIGRYADMGIDEFAIGDYTFGESRQERAEMHAAFHADILSQLL